MRNFSVSIYCKAVRLKTSHWDCGVHWTADRSKPNHDPHTYIVPMKSTTTGVKIYTIEFSVIVHFHFVLRGRPICSQNVPPGLRLVSQLQNENVLHTSTFSCKLIPLSNDRKLSEYTVYMQCVLKILCRRINFPGLFTKGIAKQHWCHSLAWNHITVSLLHWRYQQSTSIPRGTQLTVGCDAVHEAYLAAGVSPSSRPVVVVVVDVVSGGGAGGGGGVNLVASFVAEATSVVIGIRRGDVAARVAALVCERRATVTVLTC